MWKVKVREASVPTIYTINNHVYLSDHLPLPLPSTSIGHGSNRQPPLRRPAIEVRETPLRALRLIAQNASAAQERERGVRNACCADAWD